MVTAKDMSRYVIRLFVNDGNGLGVVTYPHILTCAHYYDSVPVGRLEWGTIDAKIVEDGEEKNGSFCIQTLDSLMDFMVAGMDHLMVGGAEEECSWLEEIEPALRPTDLVFKDEQTIARIPCYYFKPDGKTPVHGTARVHRNSTNIIVTSMLEAGCSGGPLFTADHHLIGIMLNSLDAGDPQSHAVRIDMAATGWLRQSIGEFASLDMAPFDTNETDEIE